MAFYGPIGIDVNNFFINARHVLDEQGLLERIAAAVRARSSSEA